MRLRLQHVPYVGSNMGAGLAFVNTPRKKSGKRRIMFSVCKLY